MLGLSARELGFYAAFAYPFALLCAIPYFSDHATLDEEQEQRRLRTAWLLVILAPVHLLFPLTALGIAREAERLATKRDVNAASRRRTRLLAVVGCIVSIAVLVSIANRP